MIDRNTNSLHVTRRHFTRGVLAIGLGATLKGPAFANVADQRRLQLGIDNFAVRAMGWKASELIDYTAQLKCDSLFITDLHAFESHDEAHLTTLRQEATDKGVAIYLGGWSICPTSVTFRDTWGSADEHLALGIRMARALGSPVYRVILGSHKDRLTNGGINARIKDTVKVLKAARTRANDAGVKVAVENHAGDMHSLELVRLIEEAGTDFVGANIDAGNAVWTLEDPLQNLDNLGKYVLTSSLRDTAVWQTPNGVKTQWVAMGSGDVDWKKYFARFAEVCPNAPVNIETISGRPREFATETDEFWKSWPNGKPEGFDRFLAWAGQGKAREPWSPPIGADQAKANQAFQRADLEKSIRYCREELGLGLR